MPPFTNKQIDRLGDRLRQGVQPDDLRMLGEYRDQHLPALAATVLSLTNIQFANALTARQKNAQTIIGKLRNEPKMELSNMQDIAGARIIVGGSRKPQDAVVQEVCRRFPHHKEVKDRRAVPTHGYRAVHVVVRANDCWAEVQVRSPYQDRWAQTFERLGDAWGRQIRAGLPPNEPESTTLVNGARVSRVEVLGYVRDLSDTIHDVEMEEERVLTETEEFARVESMLPGPEREVRRTAVHAAQRQVHQGFRDIDSLFDALGEAVPMPVRGEVYIADLAPRKGESLPHFLVAYKRSTGELTEVRTFHSEQVQEAVNIRGRLEQQHRDDPDFEVVLLASHSQDELRKTHARYFKNLGQLVKPDEDPSPSQ